VGSRVVSIVSVGAIVIDNAAVAVFAPAPFTPTKKLDVPAAVGVPEITPVLAASVSPAGKLPCAMLHVYGFVPLVAASVAEYAVPTVPPPRLVVVMRTMSAMYTTMLSACVTLWLALSTTITVKFDVAAVVGLPEITPVLAFSVNPAGSVPALTLHVSGVVPPVAPTVAEYVVPTAAVGNSVVVIASTAATEISK